MGRILFGRIPDIQLISNTGYPASANVRYPAHYRISGRKTGYPALEIGRISGIRIISISSIRPDIENGWIPIESLDDESFIGLIETKCI